MERCPRVNQQRFRGTRRSQETVGEWDSERTEGVCGGNVCVQAAMWFRGLTVSCLRFFWWNQHMQVRIFFRGEKKKELWWIKKKCGNGGKSIVCSHCALQCGLAKVPLLLTWRSCSRQNCATWPVRALYPALIESETHGAKLGWFGGGCWMKDVDGVCSRYWYSTYSRSWSQCLQSVGRWWIRSKKEAER